MVLFLLRLPAWAFCILLALSSLRALGQCTPPIACRPGNAPIANQPFGMGIYQVTLAGLDTVTNGAADGYQDYTCRARAARLAPGTSYTLTVRTNANADETVRAWLDYDRDGAFATSEQILASTGRRHTATFTVPAAATPGAIRLRIAADYANAPVPTACSTPQYSQTEDYRAVVLTAGPVPRPQARFAAADTVSCGAAVAFRDQSLNAPTSWRWDFGDGTSSTQQHPQHLYAAPGTYAVRLRACNATGCDSLTKPNYILVRPDAPRPAPCQPATAAYCCGFGLTRVQLAGLDQRSADGAAGYQDFSCAQRATLTADRPYPLQLTTGPNGHDVRVYLDLNDDGQFSGAAELLYQGLAVQSPTVTVSIPSTAPGVVYGRPLRLRLWTDAAGMPFTDACTAPQRGQVEDYSVVLAPNAAAPVAAFAVTYQQLCGPVRVAFANQTTGGATSYRWDFGDGTTSTVAAPSVHTYTRAGTYDVQLITQNAFGADTAWQQVAVAEACPSYCVPNSSTSVSSPAYLTLATLGDINNRTPRGPGTSYFDFTAQHTPLRIGSTYLFHAESPPWSFSGSGPWVTITLYLDLNQDGNFTPAEILATTNGTVWHDLAFRLPARAKVGASRLRVVVRGYSSRFLYFPDTCTPSFVVGSTEDYTVVVLPAPTFPTAGFTAELPASCSGTVQFRDTTYAGPTAWRWSFGDGQTATVQHPRHRYAAPGTYTVGLRVRNRYGADSLVRTGYVTISSLSAGPQPAACLPPQGVTEGTRGIAAFTLGAINYSQPVNAPGYRDETCAVPPAVLARGVAYPMTMRNLYAAQSPMFLWLDLNEDGAFDSNTELVYNGINNPSTITGRGQLTLPPTTPLNRPLRLRVLYADYGNPTPLATVPAPCARTPPDQIRDFTVVATLTTPAHTAQVAPAWTVFPNPATGQLTLHGHFTGPTQLEMHDALGRLLWQRKLLPSATGSAQLDVHALPRGLYLLKVNGGAQAIRVVLE